MKVLVDVWRGHEGRIYEARFIRDKEEALRIVDVEIQKGFLCNVRVLNEEEEKWPEFDNRRKQ